MGSELTIPAARLKYGADGSFSISFNGRDDATYQLEYKNSLINPVWTALPPVVRGTNGPLTLRDGLPQPVPPARFYRVRVE
jgi:hypothetical protein